jgi:hypothetical protein
MQTVDCRQRTVKAQCTGGSYRSVSYQLRIVDRHRPQAHQDTRVSDLSANEEAGQ